MDYDDTFSPISAAPVPLSDCYCNEKLQIHHLEGPQSIRLREAGFIEDSDVEINKHVSSNLVCKVNSTNVVISDSLGEQILVVHK